MEHQILSFGKGLYKYYKEEVSGNKEITYDQAARKMTRNMLLAKEVKSPKYKYPTYKYGCLWFRVNERGVIFWIMNGRRPDDWKQDKKGYVQLSKELGIEDAETVVSMTVKRIKCDFKFKVKQVKKKMKLK
jgi:hypothetical protein